MSKSMTRDEAIEKLLAATANLYGAPIVDGLVALGLLELTNNSRVVRDVLCLNRVQIIYPVGAAGLSVASGFPTEVGAQQVLDALRNAGFKIVKAPDGKQ